MTTGFTLDLILADDTETTRLGLRLARLLRGGDTVLLDGPLGAGKTHLARALIQARLAEIGAVEDVPSPTFTLVQTYEARGLEIWHADLYRLGDPAELVELGLDEALGTALCLIEWPDRMGEDRPAEALTITLQPADEGRRARLHGAPGWADRLGELADQPLDA